MSKTIIIRIIFNNLRLCNAWRKETKPQTKMRPSLSRTWMRRKELKTSSSYASRMGSSTSWTLKTKRRGRTKVVNKVFKRITKIIRYKRSITKWELKLVVRTKTVIKWTRSLPIRTSKRTLVANFKARIIALTTAAYSKEPTTPVVAFTVAINSVDLWTSAILHPSPTLIRILTRTSKILTRVTILMAQMGPKIPKAKRKPVLIQFKILCKPIIKIKKSHSIRQRVLSFKRKLLVSKILRIYKTRTSLARISKGRSRLSRKRWRTLRHQKWSIIKICLDQDR